MVFKENKKMTKREKERIGYLAQAILNNLGLFKFKQAEMSAQELKDFIKGKKRW